MQSSPSDAALNVSEDHSGTGTVLRRYNRSLIDGIHQFVKSRRFDVMNVCVDPVADLGYK